MIYIQSYHSGFVGPVQVRTSKWIPARESLEQPLVCIPRWLSVVMTALSLTVLLVCFRVSLDMTSVQVDQYVYMGCHWQSRQSGHGTTYFPTYKAADCHCASSRACNQSNRGILLVTIQSRPSVSQWQGCWRRWCLRALATSPSQLAGPRYVIYTNHAIYHLCNIPPSF